MQPFFVKAPALKVPHAFFGRSAGRADGFDCSPRTNPAGFSRNRQLAVALLGARVGITGQQAHTTRVVCLGPEDLPPLTQGWKVFDRHSASPSAAPCTSAVGGLTSANPASASSAFANPVSAGANNSPTAGTHAWADGSRPLRGTPPFGSFFAPTMHSPPLHNMGGCECCRSSTGAQNQVGCDGSEDPRIFDGPMLSGKVPEEKRDQEFCQAGGDEDADNQAQHHPAQGTKENEGLETNQAKAGKQRKGPEKSDQAGQKILWSFPPSNPPGGSDDRPHSPPQSYLWGDPWPRSQTRIYPENHSHYPIHPEAPFCGGVPFPCRGHHQNRPQSRLQPGCQPFGPAQALDFDLNPAAGQEGPNSVSDERPLTATPGMDLATVSLPPLGVTTCECDGFVTATPGVALGILTADCGPVLFWDPIGVIGACHAGWRGAISGVLENTLAQMVCLGARPGHIVAVLGPTIQVQDYPVGEDFLATARAWLEDHLAPKVSSDCPGDGARGADLQHKNNASEHGDQAASSSIDSDRPTLPCPTVSSGPERHPGSHSSLGHSSIGYSGVNHKGCQNWQGEEPRLHHPSNAQQDAQQCGTRGREREQWGIEMGENGQREIGQQTWQNPAPSHPRIAEIEATLQAIQPFLRPLRGHLCFDLPGYIANRLRGQVGHFYDVQENTFASPPTNAASHSCPCHAYGSLCDFIDSYPAWFSCSDFCSCGPCSPDSFAFQGGVGQSCSDRPSSSQAGSTGQPFAARSISPYSGAGDGIPPDAATTGSSFFDPAAVAVCPVEANRKAPMPDFSACTSPVQDLLGLLPFQSPPPRFFSWRRAVQDCPPGSRPAAPHNLSLIVLPDPQP